jgi:hypothetical protein
MKEIDNIVKKVLLESLNEKADEITNKIHSKLSGEMEEGRFKDALKDAYKRKHPEENFPPSLSKKYFPDDDDMTDIMSGEFDYVAEDECTEGNCGEMEESMNRGEGEKLMRKYHQGAYDKLLSLYQNSESPKDQKGSEDKDEDGEMEEELHGNQKKIDVAPPKGKITKADFDKFRSKKKQTDEEMEEGNAFSKKLKDTPKGEKFKLGDKTYTDTSDLEESLKYSIQFDNEELVLTENELITMIEEIVLEEKKGNLKSTGKSKGMVEFDRVHKKDEDINKKANQESFKKMKDYVKAGSKGSFDPNPKQFPKGNGELAKMDKKTYKASDAVGEYIDNFAYGGGMADLYTDEIGYNEDWLEKNIEGSAMTGNSPEYANAVDTGYGKKINKRRKEGLYNKEKRQGSYNRVKQPVDVAGENTKSGKLNKMFKNLGESEEKKEILSEEMQRMKEMIGYNKKSQ